MFIQDGQYPAILAECWSITHNYLEQQLELCEGLFQNSVLHFFTKAFWLYILFFERLKMCLGVNWVSEIMVQFFHLLHFSHSTPTTKFKAATFTIEFFCCCQSQLQSQAMSLEPKKHTKRIENNQSQTMTFWTCQVMFPKRSAKMTDGSEKCKCLLAFKLQN